MKDFPYGEVKSIHMLNDLVRLEQYGNDAFVLREKQQYVELILTGRYCPPGLIEKADLVTEMQEIKHYYQKGVAARKGIES
jgi:ATP:corrinoid adenosyltransferase